MTDAALDLCDAREAAEMLHISKRTFDRHVRGEVGCYRIGGKALYSREEPSAPGTDDTRRRPMPSDDPRRKRIAEAMEARSSASILPPNLGQGHPLLLAHAALPGAVALIEELTALVYFGEHHFPDLTWKARCEEQAKEIERLRKRLYSPYAADARAEADTYADAMIKCIARAEKAEARVRELEAAMTQMGDANEHQYRHGHDDGAKGSLYWEERASKSEATIATQAKEIERLRCLFNDAAAFDEAGQPGDGMYVIQKELGAYDE